MITSIPAISLWQPWATAMALGVKKNETRHWPTSIRGWLAIHAAKRPLDGEGRLLATVLGEMNSPNRLPFGAVVCVVKLVGCERTELLKKLNVSEREQKWGNYEDGRWAWITSPLERIEITEPIPVKGRQGIFRWSPPDWLIEKLTDGH